MVNNPLLERLWQRPHWFQETVCEWWQDPANAGSIKKVSSGSQNAHVGSCVWVCTHIGFQKRKKWRPLSHGWLKPKFAWTLPAWLQYPSCSKRPGKVPSIATPSVLLPSWVLMFHLLLEENSMSLWVFCGSTNYFYFFQFQNTAKGKSGQVTTSWEGSHKFGHNGGKGQLHLCTRTSACVCFFWEVHTHPQTTININKHTHAHTHQ